MRYRPHQFMAVAVRRNQTNDYEIPCIDSRSVCLDPFPGKPLADLGGKPMIRHVYEKARAFFDTCYVATDDERIERAVAGFGVARS